MSKIISIKRINDDKIQATLELSSKEYELLSGKLEKMHLFSENNLEYNTRLVQRGKRESTKYLLMPKDLRTGVGPSNNVSCNKIETKTKNIFVFSVNKY